jgi:hypothetical protein
MKITKILGILFVLFALIGTINFFSLLVCGWDMCLFTMSPVSDMEPWTATLLALGTMLSFPLAIVCLDN